MPKVLIPIQYYQKRGEESAERGEEDSCIAEIRMFPSVGASES